MITPLLNSLSPLGGRAAPPFAPTWVAGLRLWLRADAGLFADAGVTPAGDGDAVRQWNDQSGHGGHAVQATPAARPVRRAGILGGRPVVRFDGSAQFMLAPNPGLGDVGTLLIVARKRSAAGPQGKGLTGWSPHRQVYAYTPTGPGLNFYANAVDAPLNVGGAVEAWNAFTWRSAGVASMSIHVNGLLAAALDPFSPAAYTPLAIGASTDGGLPGDWDVAEVLAYETSLADADRAAVEAYLAARHGIEG